MLMKTVSLSSCVLFVVDSQFLAHWLRQDVLAYKVPVFFLVVVFGGPPMTLVCPFVSIKELVSPQSSFGRCLTFKSLADDLVKPFSSLQEFD